MKYTVAAFTGLFATMASAFAPAGKVETKSTTALNSFTLETIPGALAPVGTFDPLGLGAKADEKTLKRYREAELTHGRVSMLAVVGFLVGEKVESTTPFFDGTITGPAITHISQTPIGFDLLLLALIGTSELKRAEIGWVEPENVPVGRPGLLRDEYIPGNLGFDPLGLKPEDPEDFVIMQTKELQNGRLAMLAAAGMMAQELVDGKGIMEHLATTVPP